MFLDWTKRKLMHDGISKVEPNTVDSSVTITKDPKVWEYFSTKANVASLWKKRKHDNPPDLVFALLRRRSSLSWMTRRRSRSAWWIHVLTVVRVRGWLIGGSVKLTVWWVEKEPQDRGSEIKKNQEFGGHRDLLGLFSRCVNETGTMIGVVVI